MGVEFVSILCGVDTRYPQSLTVWRKIRLYKPNLTGPSDFTMKRTLQETHNHIVLTPYCDETAHRNETPYCDETAHRNEAPYCDETAHRNETPYWDETAHHNETPILGAATPGFRLSVCIRVGFWPPRHRD